MRFRPRPVELHGRGLRPELRADCRCRRARTTGRRRPAGAVGARDNRVPAERPAEPPALRGRQPGAARSHRRVVRSRSRDPGRLRGAQRGVRGQALVQHGRPLSRRPRGRAAPEDTAADLRRLRRGPLLRAGRRSDADRVQGRAPGRDGLRRGLERCRLLAAPAVPARSGRGPRGGRRRPVRQHLVQPVHHRQGRAPPRDDPAAGDQAPPRLPVRESGRRQRRADLRRTFAGLRAEWRSARACEGLRRGLRRRGRGSRFGRAKARPYEEPYDRAPRRLRWLL